MSMFDERTPEEQRKYEMDGSVNFLIPGSPSAKLAIEELERTDPSGEGYRRREMNPDTNPLIPR